MTPAARLSPRGATAAFPIPDRGGQPITRFGAVAQDVPGAAAVLRARAAANGVTLTAATPVDLAAAVVAADAWVFVTGAHDLRRPAVHGPGAVAALAGALARAAGHRRYVTGAVLDEVPGDVESDTITLIDAYRTWVCALLGQDAVGATLRRAAADLSLAYGVARAGRELDLVVFAATLDALSGEAA